MTESDKLQYNESLSDFSSLIQEYGARKVVQDFNTYFPKQSNELVFEMNSFKRGQRIAALLKS